MSFLVLLDFALKDVVCTDKTSITKPVICDMWFSGFASDNQQKVGQDQIGI